MKDNLGVICHVQLPSPQFYPILLSQAKCVWHPPKIRPAMESTSAGLNGQSWGVALDHRCPARDGLAQS